MSISRAVRALALIPLRFYQRFISPALPPTCRYAPTCSNYAIEAISTHGIIKGTLLGIWRVLRCNPWSHGGVDHVPPRGRWTPDPWIPPEDWAGHHMGTSIPMGLDEATDASSPDSAPPSGPTSQPSAAAGHATDLPAPAGRPQKTPSSPNVRSH